MATISQALAMALTHHQSGRLQAAEQIYRQILRTNPNQVDAIHLLGLIAHQGGKLHEAVARYRRTLELKPDFAAAHGNLGVALRDQGKLDEAIACYRRALELKPDYAEAHTNLGVALKDQGRLDEAIACYRRALELNPHTAEGHNNLGVALKGQGRLEEAIPCYRRALELNPRYAEAHSNLGNALKEQGKLEEAIGCYRRALELKPGLAEAHGSLGGALEEMGDLNAAEQSFREALRHNPKFAFAHYKLAEVLRGKLPDEDLATQDRLLKEGGLADEPRLFMHFGLAQALDARGDYAEAAAHLEQANALQLADWRNRGQQYDPKLHESLVAGMIAVCTPGFFRQTREFGLEDVGPDSDLPVFVVGLPRSGTTLIEQILASHSQVFGAGEIKLVGDTISALAAVANLRPASEDAERQGGGPAATAMGTINAASPASGLNTMAPLGGEDVGFLEGLLRLDRATLRPLVARHLEQLRALSPAVLRIVDKMPENYLFLGLLAALFPHAKFIHCRRDVRDVAVSCWMTHFRDVRWTNDQQHIVSRFRGYQRVMDHWRKVLPVPLLEVDYEETVADLDGVARRLVAWCGLDWEPKCLEFHRAKRPVSTASVVQVRQPVFQTSVGRWKHYAQALGPLFAQLEGEGGCAEAESERGSTECASGLRDGVRRRIDPGISQPGPKSPAGLSRATSPLS